MITMEHELITQIEKIFVYMQGARIVHKGRIELTPGRHHVKVTKLTKYLDKNSVRVKGTGKGRILNVGVEKHTSQSSKNEKVEDLRKEIKKFQKEMEKTDFLLHTWEENYQNLETFEKEFYYRAPIYLIRDKLDFEKISATNGFIKNQFAEKIKEKQDLLNKKEQLEKDIKRLTRELQYISRNTRLEEFWDIEISIDVLEKGEFAFEIQFQVNAASWEPFYDINLTEEGAELKLMANVYNRTEEDWNEVFLEISSANLRPVHIVEPEPLFIREVQPIGYSSKEDRRERSRSLKKLAAKPPAPRSALRLSGAVPEAEPFLDEMMEEPEPILQESSANFSENLGIQSYEIPDKLNIKADKQPHPVILSTFTLSTTKGYFWSSSAPDLLIIKDTLKNEQRIILPGKAKIYENNEFISETTLPLIAPFEKIDIGTRQSHDLKVTKKLSKRESAKEGILKGKISKSYSYDIQIKIFKPSERILKIMDRMPHSDSEKIKIGKVNFSMEPKKQQLGVLTWEIDLKGLKSQEEKNISYSFEVVWEKDIRLDPPLP